MYPILVTAQMRKWATDEAAKYPPLKNSITEGRSLAGGLVGELVAAEFIGCGLENTYDYDIIANDGTIVEVKTKLRTVAPQEHFECSVAEYNTKQACDVYFFISVLTSLTVAWVLGYYPKKDYLRDAVYLHKGEIDPSNDWEVSANCYNMPISSLYQLEPYA